MGWAENLKKRLKRHRVGNGAKLMSAIKRAGIDWELARTWENVDRHFERRLKKWKKSRKFCPTCKKKKQVLSLA
jgi:predicted GIY-YIG superfamily endonuclease